MAISSISNCRVAGVAAAIPEASAGLEELAACAGSAENAEKIAASTGVRRRRIAPPSLCASDLCERAAVALLEALAWPRDTIDLLAVVTQTPDYVQPATSCVLHGRLGLPKSAAALDVNLGCSGYVYGLWTTMSLLSGMGRGRALLLAGDTMSRLVSPMDRTTAPIFGDAGSATAIEFAPGAGAAHFNLGTDGRGWLHLMVPAGGFRRPKTTETGVRVQDADGNWRCDEDFRMNGLEVFAFTMREVPPMIRQVVEASGLGMEGIDRFVLHQANEFILRNLARKIGIPEPKLALAMSDYGNTSCASIPLTLADAAGRRPDAAVGPVVLAGFGVGLSWGAVQLDLSAARILPPVAVSAAT